VLATSFRAPARSESSSGKQTWNSCARCRYRSGA
jgi:hypothetical protein